MRRLAMIVAAALVLSGCMLRISTDPFTNPTSQHRTEVEPDTFSFGSTIVSTFQSGRFFDGGTSAIGWATSTDGGSHWTEGSLPGITKFRGAGPYDRASDPSVAYDARHGVWLISSLGLVDSVNPPAGRAVVVEPIDGWRSDVGQPARDRRHGHLPGQELDGLRQHPDQRVLRALLHPVRRRHRGRPGAHGDVDRRRAHVGAGDRPRCERPRRPTPRQAGRRGDRPLPHHRKCDCRAPLDQRRRELHRPGHGLLRCPSRRRGQPPLRPAADRGDRRRGSRLRRVGGLSLPQRMCAPTTSS